MVTAILFTGKIYPECFNKLIQQVSHIEHKIASIWSNENEAYIEILHQHRFIVIKNDINEQKQNVAHFIPIVNVLNYMKEHNYAFVLRTRFDILSCDFILYLDKTKHLYDNKITVISGIHTSHVYFVQFVECGTIENMCNFYKLQPIDDKRSPEVFLIEEYSNKKELTRDDVQTMFHFSLDICIKNNIEFIWYRPTWGPHDPYVKVITSYCLCSFCWTQA